MTCSTWGLYGGGHNDFDAGNTHYKGHWKGWALKIKTFGPKKIEICTHQIQSKRNIKKMKTGNFLYMSFCILYSEFRILYSVL